MAAADAVFLPTARQLKSVHGYRVLDCLIGACIDPWRPLRLRLDAQRLLIEGTEPLVLSPHAEVVKVTTAQLIAYDWAWLWPWPAPAPPGPAIELTVPPNRRWALCMPTEKERDELLQALLDAIDQSHGPGSPFVDWRFGDVLGQGTFGTVRLATRRVSTGTPADTAAVKVMSLSALDRVCDARKLVEREKRILLKLMRALPPRAPLIRLLETCTYGPHLYLFLSPACDGDLLQLLECGALPEATAAAITRGVLLAIAALHRAGIAHADIKPQNVLYRASARVPRDAPTRFALQRPGQGTVTADVLLGDFGCARELSRAPTSSAAAATAEAARGGWLALRYDHAGTLYFTPPEALDEHILATSGDVWAAGCVTFSLLHRRPPFAFDGESDEMVRLRILRAEPLYGAPPPARQQQTQQGVRTGGSGGGGGGSTIFPMAAAAAAEGAARPGMDGMPLAPLSDGARSFLSAALMREWRHRPSAEELLRDPWLAPSDPRQMPAAAASTPHAPLPSADAGTGAQPHATGGSGAIGSTPAFGSFHVEWDE